MSFFLFIFDFFFIADLLLKNYPKVFQKLRNYIVYLSFFFFKKSFLTVHCQTVQYIRNIPVGMINFFVHTSKK